MTRHTNTLFARIQEHYKIIQIAKSMNKNILMAGNPIGWLDSSNVIDCESAALNEFIFDYLEIHTDLVKLTWKNEINEFRAIDKFNYVQLLNN